MRYDCIGLSSRYARKQGRVDRKEGEDASEASERAEVRCSAAHQRVTHVFSVLILLCPAFLLTRLQNKFFHADGYAFDPFSFRKLELVEA
jgi:hypothetical protein